MNGILVVNKPQGITSHDVVARVRRIFRIRRLGHAGTLDPLATGVLVILLGKSTKLFNKFNLWIRLIVLSQIRSDNAYG